MVNHNLLYTAAALGNLSGNTAISPCLVASVLNKLAQIDATLITYAKEEDASGIDHTDETETLLGEAETALELLVISNVPEVYYCDNPSTEFPGRLRLEIPGTSWDCTSPLYFH